MGTTAPEVAHLLVAIGLLLVAAHGIGQLFVRLRQPRVIGELTGGLLLGPTLLGGLAPHLQQRIFPVDGSTAAVLGWTQQLGLLLLMFCSGAELRSLLRRDERRVVGWVTVAGVAVPLAVGLGMFRMVDSSKLIGPAHSEVALMLVFALAIAVTSIPVIARIMLDLGVMETSFARVVLGVAVLEDVVVYVVLAVALGLASASERATFGLPAALGLVPGSTAGVVAHTVATVAFFLTMLGIGGPAFRWLRRQPWNLVASSNAIAHQLVLLFVSTLACVALGVTPLFGAFLAGIAASSDREPSGVAARDGIKAFAFAFFVPVYFASVGLRLDLRHDLDPVFFAWFLAVACVVKSASVYAGARVAGEARASAVNFAVATNARGGPGIVLASVTAAAGIISAEFYASLVMLAVVTSMLAGTWLGHVVRAGRPLREQPRAVRSRRRRTAGARPRRAGADRRGPAWSAPARPSRR